MMQFLICLFKKKASNNVCLLHSGPQAHIFSSSNPSNSIHSIKSC